MLTAIKLRDARPSSMVELKQKENLIDYETLPSYTHGRDSFKEIPWNAVVIERLVKRFVIT